MAVGDPQRLTVEVDADSEVARAILAGDLTIDGLRVVNAAEVPKRSRYYMILVRDIGDKDAHEHLDVGKTTTIKGTKWTVERYVQQSEYDDMPEGIHGLPAF